MQFRKIIAPRKIKTVHAAYQRLRQKDNEIQTNLKLMDSSSGRFDYAHQNGAVKVLSATVQSSTVQSSTVQFVFFRRASPADTR